MLNHSDSTLAVVMAVVLALGMFAAGWVARSMAVSDLPICETITIRDGANISHQFEVCK